MPDLIPHALRVPVRDRWLYIRSGGGAGPRCYDRTVGCAMFVVCATEGMAVVQVAGLPFWELKRSSASVAEMAGELDAHLLALGAEIVPPEEWPAGGVGAGHRSDRPPYRREDCTIADWAQARRPMKAEVSHENR